MSARRAATVGAGAALALVALAGCAAPTAVPEPQHQHHSSAPTSEAEVGASFNEQDVMFNQMMIPHHAQAVEMSEIILAKEGVDPRVVELAEQIRDAQGPEIEQMTRWLEDLGQPSEMPHMAGMDHEMEGMLTDEQLADLRAADGETGTRLFLEGMIAHHDGAVLMAQIQLRAGAHPEVQALAEQIIADQQAEIAAMREMLAAG